jgi:hypothetical protein
VDELIHLLKAEIKRQKDCDDHLPPCLRSTDVKHMLEFLPKNASDAVREALIATAARMLRACEMVE